MKTPKCDVCPRRKSTQSAVATYDLGRYRRVTGIVGKTRYLCESCATGVIPQCRRQNLRIAYPQYGTPTTK